MHVLHAYVANSSASCIRYSYAHTALWFASSPRMPCCRAVSALISLTGWTVLENKYTGVIYAIGSNFSKNALRTQTTPMHLIIMNIPCPSHTHIIGINNNFSLVMTVVLICSNSGQTMGQKQAIEVKSDCPLDLRTIVTCYIILPSCIQTDHF